MIQWRVILISALAFLWLGVGNNATEALAACPPPPPDSTIIGDFGPPWEPMGFAFSPNGEWVSAVFADGTVLLWNAEKNERVDLVPCYPRSLDSMVFSRDSSLLALGDADAQVRIMEIPSGELRQKLNKGMGGIERMLFSDDGKLLVVAHDKGIVIWEWETGKSVFAISQAPRNGALAISPDGRTLAFDGPAGTIRVWSIPLQREIAVLPLGEEDWASDLVFANGGHWLISAQGSGAVVAWPALGGGRLRIFREDGEPLGFVHISTAGDTLFSVDEEGLVRSWSLDSGESLTKWAITPGWISGNGELLATYNEDAREFQVWRIATRAKISSFRYVSPSESPGNRDHAPAPGKRKH